MFRTPAILALTLAASAAAAQSPVGASFTLPVPDPSRGRMLFVHKGCVVCHRVNGVGGTAGPALDASEPAGVFDPLDFAARMWKGAEAMAALQSMEFGYVINLTGRDIADLAAFSENHVEQSRFSEAEIPETVRGWTLDAPIDDALEMKE